MSFTEKYHNTVLAKVLSLNLDIKSELVLFRIVET